MHDGGHLEDIFLMKGSFTIWVPKKGIKSPAIC
jgi:hypothetical protein